MRREIVKKWGAFLLVLTILLGLEAPALAFTELLTSSNSLPMMVEGELPEVSGDGVVIAVIDSGFLVDHEVFKDYGLSEGPALSREAVESFVGEGGTPGKYISPRIPFAYDYSTDRQNVYSTDSHGTHVAAIVAGYAENEDGSVRFRGVAPAAQLLLMKVFPDGGGATANDTVLRAIEDAEALGADIISLSLGTDNGFVDFDDMDGKYVEAFQRLREEGILLCCAAGNSSAVPIFKDTDVPLPTGDYTDYGTLSSPGSFKGALPVAAADADTYMDEGFIALGEENLSYVDAEADDGGTVPKLETLHGKALPLVLVPGKGTPEDFSTVDVRGKIALVERGEITFGEKAQAAADRGAKACLVYDVEPGVIRASVPSLSIPCATVTQEDGELLCAAAERGESITVRRDAYLKTNEGETRMMDASSWGCAPDLRLAPRLTAPGGNILSAVPDGKREYQQYSGTSMAAPNCTGALALCLEALRERGIQDKRERADLAEKLLESTARILTDEAGTPLSPRQQGAGLVDITAALETELVMMTPILEPGDDVNGKFTLPIRVKNLGGEDKEVELSASVLTDDYLEDEAGTWSALLPLDITEQVQISGMEPFTVPAGGEVTRTLTLTLNDSIRQELSEVYPNGFFVEGFITARADGEEAHSTFLSYCGDWGKAPILEDTDLGDILDSETAEEDAPQTEMGGKLVYRSDGGRREMTRMLLGEGEAMVPYLEERAAIGGAYSNAVYVTGYMAEADIYTLRNARHLVVVVSAGNTPVAVMEESWVAKTGPDPVTMELMPSVTIYVDGLDGFGEPIPNDTRLTVSVYGWLEGDEAMERTYAAHSPDPERPESYRWLMGGYDSKLQWRFGLTLDSEAPKAEARLEPQGLTVTLRENQFLDWASLWAGEEQVLAEDAWGDERKGESHELFVSAEALAGIDVLRLAAADYAGNVTGFTIDLGELDSTPKSLDTCPVALLQDVSPEARYHEAVDHVLLWGLMEDVELGKFDPAGAATRAQVLSALYAISGDKTESITTDFKDVPATMIGREAILWAVENGIAEGFAENNFLPLAPVSRQQLAVFLYRFADHIEADTSARAELDFADSQRISSWATEAVAWAVGEGILTLDSDGRLDPRGNVTRAQLAEVFFRLTGETEETA